MVRPVTIRLHCTPTDLVRVRFAISPMWETRQAARLLTTRQLGSPHGAWLRAARVRARSLDLTGLAALTPRHGYSPDFLSPPPAGPGTTFAEELELVRSTPLVQVRTEIARSLGRASPRGARWLLGDPAAALTRLADSLAATWETLVGPTWPAICDVLEGDIAHHSRASAREGAHAMVAGLDERVSWDVETGVLELHTRVEEERHLEGQGLVLMPSSFVWPNIVAFTERPWRPTIVYPARGIGVLWSDPVEPPQADGLARLLGARRAAILQVLGTPSTTSRLARSMSMSLATVSEHLGVLHEAGLVSRRRVGRSVEYQRTTRGTSLVQGCVREGLQP